MKLEEVKQAHVEKSSYAKIIGLNNDDWEQISKVYALQKCKEQREICYQNAEVEEQGNPADPYNTTFAINKESITEAQLPEFD